MSEMTVCEKILSRTSGQESVRPGEIIEARPDLAMSHDNTYLVYRSFKEVGASRLKDPSSIVVVLDHRAPASTVNSANTQRFIREIVNRLGIENFFDIGTGICHQLLIERGLVKPGMLILGTDSHSTTYGSIGAMGTGIGATDMASVWSKGSLWLKVPATIRVEITGATPKGVFAKDLALILVGKLGVMGADYCCIEFYGEYISNTSISERMTLCNMAAEAGAKSAIVPSGSGSKDNLSIQSCSIPDKNATYLTSLRIDSQTAEPIVAAPPSVDNVVSVRSVEGTKIDQAFLGSCTNGRLDDLAIAASMLNGKKVRSSTRLIITPASSEIYLAAAKEGILEILVRSGAVVTNPGCGPCLGAHQGILADGETCISSSNRNFRGRMGSRDAEIYLASPATVVASAIEGKIADPRRYLE